MTLQGSSRPTSGSALRARLASTGLQAPRMAYRRKSTPIFSLSVAWMSISLMTPKPSPLRASLARAMAVS